MKERTWSFKWSFDDISKTWFLRRRSWFLFFRSALSSWLGRDDGIVRRTGGLGRRFLFLVVFQHGDC